MTDAALLDDLRRAEVSGLSGWAVKPWALWTSRFDRCFWLDVDNVPLVDPTLGGAPSA